MTSSPQDEQLGLFQGHTDVGRVGRPGSASYDAKTQTYMLAGSGSNMWFDHDEFQFLWIRLKGDFLLSARAAFVGKGAERYRKLGWTVRSTLAPDSRHVNASLHGDGLMSLQYRKKEGDGTLEVRSAVDWPDVIQLERRGTSYVMFSARFGDTLTATEAPALDLGEELYVGLYVCSHNNDLLEHAVFRDVRIVVPPKEDFVPYKDYIGSDLEVMDVSSGERLALLRSPESLQAPNWTRDGKALIYNRNGRLYRFDLARRSSEEINTEFASANNNDHVLSFDGRMIGISHHVAEEGNRSIIYTLPIEGGTPNRVTAHGPSYLHGWSPDDRFLIYTGERNGLFNIYRISVDGGEETRLTSSHGLDDGSEFSPDGQFIYFNSTRTGLMQLWRMRPDGSRPEQLTDDGFNNWFPHVSPDGKWIAFLSYGRDVHPEDHPFYRRVYIRLMPAGGGAPKVLAYVYGGQGTINVPSWSPDGKRLAFVSNTDLQRSW